MADMLHVGRRPSSPRQGGKHLSSPLFDIGPTRPLQRRHCNFWEIKGIFNGKLAIEERLSLRRSVSYTANEKTLTKSTILDEHKEGATKAIHLQLSSISLMKRNFL